MDEKTKFWMAEARRYSLHIHMYGELLDDHPELTAAAIGDGQSPYEYVEWLGAKYGLDRVDQGWGFNAGQKFNKNPAFEKVAS